MKIISKHKLIKVDLRGTLEIHDNDRHRKI